MGGMPESTPPPLEPIAVAGTRVWSRAKTRRRHRIVWAVVRALDILASVVPWVLAAGALGVVVVGAVFGWQSLKRSPALQVKHIAVRGLHRTSRQEVLAYAGADLRQPILGLDLDAMALRLRQHPWVERAVVRRQLPDRLHIHIVEHEPVLLVSLGELYLADAQGQLFKRFAAQDGVDLPVVTGIDREGAAQHADEVKKRLGVAIDLAQAVSHQHDALGRLEEMHWDEDLGWNIVLQLACSQNEVRANVAAKDVLHPGVRAQLGHAPLAHLGRVASTLAILADKNRTPDVIWADGGRTPERVAVELLAEKTEPSNIGGAKHRR